jgi:hypothetical protein
MLTSRLVAFVKGSTRSWRWHQLNITRYLIVKPIVLDIDIIGPLPIKPPTPTPSFPLTDTHASGAGISWTPCTRYDVCRMTCCVCMHVVVRIPTRYTVHLVCWSSASCIGGIRSTNWSLLQNNSSLASVNELVLSYRTTTSLSMVLKWSDSAFKISNGCRERCTNVSVTSSYACQACQADFLPLPLKAEVVSQPVRAWNTGKARALRSPRLSHYSIDA